MGWSEKRGGGGGRGSSKRRRRSLSGACERKNRGGDGDEGVSGRVPGGRGGAEEKARGVVVASVTQAGREVRGAAGARALSPSSAFWQR